MTENKLHPRLTSDRASAIRKELLRDPYRATFDPVLLEEVISDSRAFPPTGGLQMGVGDLLDLRATCQTSLRQEVEAWTPSGFDLKIGRVLHQQTTGPPGEFGNSQVWDFLTLVLLPDLAMTRIPLNAKGAEARLTGGNRRHVFQRLWRRWQVFGAAIVESNFLTEDDYVALLERRLSSQNKEVARRVVIAIYSSGSSGSARRDFTRTFMRQLIQASGIVDISHDDPAHLDALFTHLSATTGELLETRPNRS